MWRKISERYVLRMVHNRNIGVEICLCRELVAVLLVRVNNSRHNPVEKDSFPDKKLFCG